MLKPEDVMKEIAKAADESMRIGVGGPFGAAVVKDDEIVCISTNSVLRDHDPTAHAEINVLRNAGEILGTHNLEGCTLYATGYPCPMCMSAIIWANIKKVYVANSVESAEEIGFRDEFIYQYLRREGHEDLIDIEFCSVDEAAKLYADYKELDKEVY